MQIWRLQVIHTSTCGQTRLLDGAIHLYLLYEFDIWVQIHPVWLRLYCVWRRWGREEVEKSITDLRDFSAVRYCEVRGQISPHFVWFLVNTHLRKAFSKCLVFCDILESPTPQLAFAEDWTKLWGDHPPALALTGPGVGLFLTHICTVCICLTLVRLVFWEGPLDSYDFLRSQLRVEPSVQVTRHSQELSLHAAIQCYTAPMCSPFGSCLF